MNQNQQKLTLMKVERSRISEIYRMAGSIARNYYNNSAIDPYHIAKDNGITIHEDDFGETFEGSICCNMKTKKFHIFMNNNPSISMDPGRTRFTLAHELGHYFIPEHRKMLESGENLTYHPNNYFYIHNNIFETEAHIFSANLLMPRKTFIEKGKSLPYGMEGIITLAELFQTSILSTAYQYINCDIVPLLLVKLDDNGQSISCKTATSRSFSSLLKERIVVQYNEDRPLTDSEIIEISEGTRSFEFNQSVTNLSSWAGNISSSSDKNLVVVEQTLKIGSFGSIAIIFPSIF